jgi:hypothetical protein
VRIVTDLDPSNWLAQLKGQHFKGDHSSFRAQYIMEDINLEGDVNKIKDALLKKSLKSFLVFFFQ